MTTAFKYTSSGYVRSNCSATTKNGAIFVTFAVTDSGIGISEEDLFEMFVDLKTHPESNKGFGLYMVKKGIGILGSFCSVVPNTDNTVEGGSIFLATFPEGEDNLEYERDIRCSKSFNLVKSVLVVDDTSTIVLVMKRALQEDHHVDVAYNGKEALGLMLQKEYDYVFMDIISMPLMGGLEAASEFREQEESLQRGNKQTLVILPTSPTA